jgi:hypothetical protein
VDKYGINFPELGILAPCPAFSRHDGRKAGQFPVISRTFAAVFRQLADPK